MPTGKVSTPGQSSSGPSVQLYPHKEQAPFLGTDKRYYAFISGIGAGKTTALVMRALANAFEFNPGHTGYIIAPTTPSLRNVIIPEMEKWGVFDIPGANYNRSENWLELPNGSKIIFESADNDRKIERLRGPSIAWFLLDEAAILPKKVWDIMIGRLRVGSYRNAGLCTTPRGYNWVFRRFVEDNPDDVEAILGVPSHANPHLPEDYFEITEEYEGAHYEQEVLGQFTDFEGLVYDWFNYDTHVVDLDEALGRPYEKVYYGVDWGFNNPAVILAFVEKYNMVYAVDEFYERRVTVNEMAEVANQLQDHWGQGTFYCDPAEPSSIEEFQRSGIRAVKADNSVTPGIQHVTSRRDELRVSETCQELINEFNQYQYDDDSDKDAPLKQNDHSMDAARYGLFSEAQQEQKTIPSTWR